MVMHAKSGSPPHTGQTPRFHAPNAGPCPPASPPAPNAARCCSTSAARHEKRTQRPGQHFLEHLDAAVGAARSNHAARAPADSRRGRPRAAARRPRRRPRRAAQHVGDLAEEQPRVGPVDGQAIEVEQRLSAGQSRRDLVGRQRHRGRRDAHLHAPHRVDQFDLQRRRSRQLGLPLGQRSKFGDVARIGRASCRGSWFTVEILARSIHLSGHFRVTERL